MTKVRVRRLWLAIKYDAPGASRKKVIDTLLRSTKNGTYEYPRRWRVALGWSNNENGDLKWGEFTSEMKASAESSEGFDKTVIMFLEGKKEDLQK